MLYLRFSTRDNIVRDMCGWVIILWSSLKRLHPFSSLAHFLQNIYWSQLYKIIWFFFLIFLILFLEQRVYLPHICVFHLLAFSELQLHVIIVHSRSIVSHPIFVPVSISISICRMCVWLHLFGFITVLFLWGGVISWHQTPQPRGSGYSFLSGPFTFDLSSMWCLPVAVILPAYR